MTAEDQPKDNPSQQFVKPTGIPSEEAVGTPTLTIAEIQEAFSEEDLSHLNNGDIEVVDDLPADLGESVFWTCLGKLKECLAWVKKNRLKAIAIVLLTVPGRYETARFYVNNLSSV